MNDNIYSAFGDICGDCGVLWWEMYAPHPHQRSEKNICQSSIYKKL